MSGTKHSDMDYLQKVEARLEVKDDDLIRDGINVFLSKMDTISQEFETQKEKLMIEKMRE